MQDFAQQLQDFARRLDANPRVIRTRNEFDYEAKPPGWFDYMLPSFQEMYGFAFPEGVEQLLGFPEDVVIAWVADQTAVPPHLQRGVGAVELTKLSMALHRPLYRINLPDNEDPRLDRAYMFDPCTELNSNPSVVWLAPESGPGFEGLGILGRWELTPLPLTISEYLTHALTWHGGFCWFYLYCDFADFCRLHSTTLSAVCNLLRLPELFPEADWSVVDTKREYFDFARPFAR